LFFPSGRIRLLTPFLDDLAEITMSPSVPATKTISIGDRAINLTQVLKLAGCAESGGAAKALIAAGQVQVNGQVELRKRCQMKAGDTIVIEGGPTIVLAVSNI
jgi:ribosome-associated protein